jgi:RNA polymerase sigma-70 factor (ECF subfamily)
MVDVAIPETKLAYNDDCEIARDIASGDHAAFERLMRRHNRRLYRLARATLRDRTEAEDALQDAYVCAYRSIEQFRGEASLSTWLSRLVLNECFARLRRTARRQNVISIVTPDAPMETICMAANDPETPDTELARAQMRDLLERKLDELPENFRTVFVLRSVEEMSVDETAQCLGIPEETVRSRHFRAKSLLKESLTMELESVERDVFHFGGEHCDRIVATVLARLTSH